MTIRELIEALKLEAKETEPGNKVFINNKETFEFFIDGATGDLYID